MKKIIKYFIISIFVLFSMLLVSCEVTINTPNNNNNQENNNNNNDDDNKNNNVTAIDMTSKTINVYLIAGQSNAVGFGLDSSNEIANSDSRFVNGFDNVLYYADQEYKPTGSYMSSKFEPVRIGFGDNTNTSGAEIGIASEIADNGEMNAIIKCAWGATHLYPDTNYFISIEQGTWTSPSYIKRHNLDVANNPGIGEMYRRFEETVIRAIKLLIEDGYTPVIKGMWWMQGEAETGNTTMSGAYEELYRCLISDVRSFMSEATGYDCSEMPFVCGLVKHNDAFGTTPATLSVVRNAMTNVAEDPNINNVSYVDCMPLTQQDAWHFDAAGQKYLGENFIKEVNKMKEVDIDKLVSFNNIKLLAKEKGLEFVAKIVDYKIDNKYEYGFLVVPEKELLENDIHSDYLNLLNNENIKYNDIKCEVYGNENDEYYDIYIKGQFSNISYEDLNTSYAIIAYVKDENNNYSYSYNVSTSISVLASKELLTDPNNDDIKNIVNAGVNLLNNISETEGYMESALELIVESEINLINSQNKKPYNINVEQSPNANYYVKYSSSNEDVATVDGLGNIITHNAGTATITINCGGKTKTVRVNVANKTIDDVVYDGIVSDNEYGDKVITRSNNNTSVDINGIVIDQNIHLAFVINHGEWSKLNRQWNFNDNIEMYVDGNKYIIQFIDGVIKFSEGVFHGVTKTTISGDKLETTVEMCIEGNKDKYKLMLALAGDGFEWLPALWDIKDQPDITTNGLILLDADSNYSLVSANKEFIPNGTANNNIWSTDMGYATLTDGILSNDFGRFSTKTNQNGTSTLVDATLNLGARYTLYQIKFYYFSEYWVEGSHKYPTYVGNNLKVEVYNKGEWTTLFDYTASDLSNYVVSSGPGAGNSYLEFSLDGIKAEKIRFSSNSALNGKSISYYEIEVFAYKNSIQEIEEINVFEGKTFIPTNETKDYIYNDNYGYGKLTDGSLDISKGRFSTKTNDIQSKLDATLDLGKDMTLYELIIDVFNDNVKFLGKDFTVEVYVDGSWLTVISCANNDEIAKHYDNVNNQIRFDLGGVSASKVRIYSSGRSGTSYETGDSISIDEISCLGSYLSE